MAALLWLIIGIVLVVAEVLSGAFVLVMLGAPPWSRPWPPRSAPARSSAASCSRPSRAGGITLARPALVRHMHLGEHVKTNVDALVGSKALVTTTVDAHTGQVKVNGEIWSARAYDETEVLEPGRTVTIMSISGATALVWGGL